MKLTPDESRQLIARCDGEPLGSVLDDACEVVTTKLILRLKAKQRALKQQRDKLPLGDPQADVLKAQMRILGECIVELAETP